MKYLCLLHLNAQEMKALSAEEMNSLNARHLDLNDDLRASGYFIEAEALEPATTARSIRVRPGKPAVIDGPFTESKEVVAGFYLIEAEDMAEAVQIAARFPSAPHGRVDIWPTRQLIVEGR